MTLLRVSHLSKHFTIHHLGRTVRAFEDLSFTLAPGEFKLVSGVNGAGKSTLLRCLYRSALPTAGEALYRAQAGDIDLARAHDADISLLRTRELGFVSQFLRPRPRRTALQLVLEGALHGDRDAAGDALGELGLRRELWNAYPSTFSGGEQQKVNLARALVRPQRLLLLDEPTASLDAGARAALAGRLRRLKAQGVALLGIFHHPADVAGLLNGEVRVAPPEATPREGVLS